MSDPFQFFAGTAFAAIQAELALWQTENKLARLWDGDATLWTNADEGQWLGWLTASESELCDIPGINALATTIKAKGYQHIAVLGMGGSSLCPDMIAKTFSNANNYPRLAILDSTDPNQIQDFEKSIDLKKTFFIISSKSGTTLEPNIFKQYFMTRLQSVLKKTDVGEHFLAITDPGTPLEELAQAEQFKAVFHGLPTIGGRYSALSHFGMVPAGLMGLDIKAFLSHAMKMKKKCAASVSPPENPAVLLGIILGVCAKLGKDKVTFIISPEIKALGAWLEQLLAESTGKLGKGLIPIADEPLGEPECYSRDRVFIYIRSLLNTSNEQDKAVERLEQLEHTVVRLKIPDKQYLGCELFLWEMATAVAGCVLNINAFDQPDVEGSKKLAVNILAEYQKTKIMPKPLLILDNQDIQLYSDQMNIDEIKSQLIGEASIVNCLRAHLSRIKRGDYVNLSAFIEMSQQHIELLQQCRTMIRDEKRVATCLGFGPRFLHSTGQDYKGGPNTGVFLQITAEVNHDITIPGGNNTFGLVIAAQAQADFEVLAQRSRRVLRVHLGKDLTASLAQFQNYLAQALAST